MKIKLSHVAVGMFASISFSVFAVNTATLVEGQVVTADADVVVNATSTLGLTITPASGLTVEGVKNGRDVTLANFKLTGSNAAVRFLNPDSKYKYCTTSSGVSNNENTLQLCLDKYGNSFQANGVLYYPYAEGEHRIRAGSIFNPKVGADTYKITMEAVQYKL